jgi:hypothetical protein
VLGGVAALSPDLATFWAFVATVPLIAILVCRLLPGPRALVVAGMVLGAILIPVFGLLGVDWLWARLGGGRLDPLASVITGAVIVGLAAFAYLNPWWVRERTRRRGLAAFGIAMLLVVVPPIVLLVYGEIKGTERALTAPSTVVSQLDVIVLSETGESSPIDPEHTRGWRIRPWIGKVAGDEVHWGPEGAPPPAPAVGTDRVVLLLVDGAPERRDDAKEPRSAPRGQGEVRRWLGLVDGLALERAPTFALLNTTDEARLARWRDPLARRDGEPHALQEFADGQTLADLALKFGVSADTSEADLALAAQHRPALFFDRGERYRTPLNVDQLLTSGKMRLCDRGQDVRTLCAEIDESADLHNGADHIAFDPDELAEVRNDSTIYVNVTRSGNAHRNAVNLDYWWYLPDNPSGSGGGAFCGAGFVIAGITCHDHQSDWEGITVILDGDSRSSSPTAVAYAQHGGVTRYTWRALQELWGRADRARFAEGIDTTRRPLVFVAQGTHASYPRSCAHDKCTVGGSPASRRSGRSRRTATTAASRGPATTMSGPRRSAWMRSRRAATASPPAGTPSTDSGAAPSARSGFSARRRNRRARPPRSAGTTSRGARTRPSRLTAADSSGRPNAARGASRRPTSCSTATRCSRWATPSRPGREPAPTTPVRTVAAIRASAPDWPGHGCSRASCGSSPCPRRRAAGRSHAT